ncbi:MAG: single-stranded-DNA-specific exonuclease RecJ [Thermoleophilaceae bacterium]|nr:single-stranded-DNA-specific exonuclease RecJ [Thermoleophilaceae bacterium]
MAIPNATPMALVGDEGTLPTDIAVGEPLVHLGVADSVAIATLSSELNLPDAVAQALVRRGFLDSSSAAEFLAGGQLVAPSQMPGMEQALDLVCKHLDAGGRIAIHGDYDADGICSTTLLVEALAALGASVTWHVPSRFHDGYGLGAKAIERFAADAVALVIAVDCGITAVAEAELARSLGMDLLIIDHHQPGPELPEAVIVHPGVGEYPNPMLCATAVAWKLVCALTARLQTDLVDVDDLAVLAGIATVTDVMPLLGENRALVKLAVEGCKNTSRPGLIELMAVSDVDPLRVDAATFGFRLGPRLNAAGRMRSAEAGVELLLTRDATRATVLAAELHGLNSERQEIEREILAEAEGQARRQRDRFAIVVAGEGWHEGVLGIVAGRLAQKYRRPCVALSVGDEFAKGSGRGGGHFDLLAGLEACSEHLLQFGGHKAAAGLSLDAAAVNQFTAALQEYAAKHLTPDDLRPRFSIDAICDPAAMTLELAQSLRALGPFGNTNPEPLLLLPATTMELGDRMGKTRQHARLTVSSPAARVKAVAFDWASIAPAGSSPFVGHAVASLQRNEWNGRVEPQVQLRAIVVSQAVDQGQTTQDPSTWSEQFNSAALASPHVADGVAPRDALSLLARATDRRDANVAAVLAELLSAGNSVTLISTRPQLWHRAIDRLSGLELALDRLQCVDYPTASALPADAAVVFVEPPLEASELALAASLSRPVMAWRRGVREQANQRIAALTCERTTVAEFWRLLGDGGPIALPALRAALEGAKLQWIDATIAARYARGLEEIGLLKFIRSGEMVEALEAQKGARTALDQSPTFRAYSELSTETVQCLEILTTDN